MAPDSPALTGALASSGRPALVPGYVAVDASRRFYGRLADVGIAVVAMMLPYLVFLVLFTGSAAAAGAALISYFALVLTLSILGIVLPIRLSAPIGYAVLGMRFIDVATGKPCGGKVVGKYFLEGVLPIVGIVVAVVTMDDQNRNWFDRLVGVQLVDWQRPSSVADLLGTSAQPRSAVSERPFIPAAPAEWSPTPPPPTPPRQTQPGLAMPAEPATFTAPAAFAPEPPVAFAPEPPAAPRSEVPRTLPEESPAPVAPEPTGGAGPEAPATGPLTRRSLRPFVTLDTGETAIIDGPLLLGRDPGPIAAVPGGRPRLVLDPERSLSKTHLALGADAEGLWVMDCHSTNGTRVEHEGTSRPVAPWVRTHVGAGDVVRYGDRSLTITSTGSRP